MNSQQAGHLPQNLPLMRRLMLIVALMIPLALSGQITKIMGKVIDAETKDPIPFVNILLKNTTVGTQTNFEGEFSMETRTHSDSLLASFIGYHRQAKAVQKGKFQTINFELVPANVLLKEVVILPGENPAEIMLKKIIQNKINNDREKLEFYQYEAYTKIQFDANNISEKFKNRRIFKPFQFIFDNLDTSTINGKAYLPIFLSETLSDVYFRKSPKSEIEVIRASQVSGIKNQSISQFLGDVIQNVNIYNNFIQIFQKNFVSPVANFGLTYYKYYLVDSTFIDKQWCYKIMYKPRRPQELTFTGSFWVHDTTWGIRKVDMKIAADANINFINDLVVNQEYVLVNNNQWMLAKDVLVADFNVVEEAETTMGFYGRKTTSYRNFLINSPMSDAFYASPVNIIVQEGSLDREAEFWKTARHDSLTRDEKTIYHMIDTLKTLPAFRTYVDVVKMITTGYYIKGNFEWGPYMSYLSFNRLEGGRFRVGGRTSNDFSTRIMLSGHVAYGTLDKTYKYGAGALYMLNKNPRRTLSANFKYDIEQLGQSQFAFREDFLLAAVFRRQPSDKLSMVEEYKGQYEHEWFNGLMNTVSFNKRSILSVGNTRFRVYDPEQGLYRSQASITTTEVGLETRLAYKEKFVMGEFERTSLGAKYPVLQVKYTYGIPHFLESDYEFHRLQLTLEHWFNIGAYGWSKYIIETGRIFGDIPFPLLKLHEGNETYSFDEYAFNSMNYYEFVSDRYLSAYYTHHFEGLFLNRIPLLRKLKWREVGYVKGLVGNLGHYDRTLAELPSDLYTLNKPYFEAGAGIENIFRILRVDAVWRLSYLDHPEISKFGIRFTLWFSF
ncbi:MAG TPA: DUF5686 family protein [Bacteroidales bacterium]|nr:DUF5686 family protein [Bacteroidales bacterium]HSA42832.1 DUF5686 family protein [Bacteroidales bacterium]